MKYGSVCSGIESASVAWEPLGFEPSWFSEIEAFPSAVLAHHYPNVQNLGDMTQLPAMVRMGLIEAPDVLVGGTPCQAFSIAGKRESLDDERGQLTLTYVDLLDAIDEMRTTPATCVWENVPGVLNTKDNAFGCFLGALAGEDVPLEPAGGGNGRTRVTCLVPKEQSRGESLTPNISDWHNDANVCFLSQVLEKGSIPEKYFLSQKACEGILRRAEKRGKKLPDILMEALTPRALC